MAWELRNGRNWYYYRAHKCGGRMVKEYVGAGPRAEHAAAEDVRRQAERAKQWAANQAQRQERKNELVAVAELTRASNLLMEIVLNCSGYHQHGGSAWRRRRNACENDFSTT
jgi:hypothetical protein